ncbi:MAG: hypothetical protein ACRD0P_17180 [Stackebrandtia sp.]
MASSTDTVSFKFREERDCTRFFTGQSLSLLGNEISDEAPEPDPDATQEGVPA